MKRRSFLESSAAAGVVAALSAIEFKKAHAANDKISICMMGVRGRGEKVLLTFADLPEVELRYVCDLDEAVRESRLSQVEQKTEEVDANEPRQDRTKTKQKKTA